MSDPKCPDCGRHIPCDKHLIGFTGVFRHFDIVDFHGGRTQLEELAKAIVLLSDKDRAYLWDRLKAADKFCLKCGETTNGGACWGCYDSRPGD